MLGNSHFNSRPHGGRRTPPATKVAIAISTHALTEGDTFFFDCVPILPYFNSRPHGGRRSFPASWNVSGKISTHALTEGDGVTVGFPLLMTSFQLTPSRRATQPVFLPHIRVFHFNSRPHGGRHEGGQH